MFPRENPGFCNTAHLILSFLLWVVFSPNNLFVSFDTRDISLVFHAADFHWYMLKKKYCSVASIKKIVFYNSFVFMYVARKLVEEVFETFVCGSFV